MSTYEIHEGEEYYDWDDCDIRGYPKKKWRSSSSSFDTHHRPVVGKRWEYEENGKKYSCEVKAVHSNGAVYDDVESLDVEYSIHEMIPVDNDDDNSNIYYEDVEYQPYPLTNLAKVKKDGKCGIVNHRTHQVLIPVEYDDIFWFKNRYYNIYWNICKDGKWTLLDADYKPTTPNEKDFFFLKTTNKIKIIGGGESSNIGVVDNDNNILFPFLYSHISIDDNHLIHVVDENSVCLYDRKGKKVLGPYGFISKPEKNKYQIRSNAGIGLVILGKKRILGINRKTVIIPPLHESVSDFVNGYCEVKTKFFYGKGMWDYTYVKGRYDMNENYEILDNPIKIYPKQFKKNEDLKSIIIPESVLTIGEEAFEGCCNLSKINLPKAITIIHDSVFWGCRSLRNIDIPKSVKIIDKHAFAFCESLEELTIPDSVKSIQKGAFMDCKKLKSIIIPEGITELEDELFEGCESLKRVVIPESVKSIGDNTFNHCGFESITLNVNSICYMAFSVCKSLKSVIFGESVESIGMEAFKNCVSLESVYIPAHVKYVGRRSFAGCENLKTVTISREAFNESWNQFPKHTTIHFL